MIKTSMGILHSQWKRWKHEREVPWMLTWTLTFRCNARCAMCDSWKKDSQEELTRAEALQLISKLPRSLRVVRLTGGEPFVRLDLDEIAQRLEDTLDLDALHLTTNGFLTKRIADFLSRRAVRTQKPIHLLLSLDGLKDYHNHVRGREFAWDAAYETLKMLVAHRRQWHVKIAVNQTIVDEESLEQYDLLHQELQDLGVDHHVVVAYRESATYHMDSQKNVAPQQAGEYQLFHPIAPGRLKSFLDRAEKDCDLLSRGHALAKRYYLHGVKQRLLYGQGNPNPPCAALGGHLRIYPNGDLPVCQFNSQKVGNLKDQIFADVWHSDRALIWKDWVDRCAGCWAECEVLPSAVHSGDLLWFGTRSLFP